MTTRPRFKIDHTNINVRDLDRSLRFYREALGLKEVRRHKASDGSFTLAFITDERGEYEIELTCLESHRDEPYDLGENEWHINFRVDDMEAAHKLHEEMGCICFENKEMGLYFIEDPDGYWLEITPMKKEEESKRSGGHGKRKAIVLAAGKGTRMHSEQADLPKVLRKAHDKPLIGYVLEKIDFLPKEDTILVIGYKGEEVKQFAGDDYVYVWQEELLGTGHAVQMAKDELADYNGPVLVCYGDMPLLKKRTYEAMFEAHEMTRNDCTVLAYITDRQLPYGRIIRDEQGAFQEVIEERDCTEEQKKIRELNAGVYVFDSKMLLRALDGLKANNAQKEYYLTDVPALILASRGKIGVVQTQNEYEGLGVNTVEDLETVEQILTEEKA